MKKWILGLGLILIFVGVAMASSYNRNYTTIKPVLVKRVDNEWSISSDFLVGDRIVLDFPRPGSDWAWGIFPEEGCLYVYIDFIDPRGNVTTFEVPYLVSEKGGQLTVWPTINITYDGGGLDTTPLYNKTYGVYWGLGGVIRYKGTYNASVFVYPSREYPPSSLNLYKGEIVTEHPYTALLPIGVVVVVAGATTTLFGLRSEKGKYLNRKKSSRFIEKRMIASSLSS